MLLGFFLGLMCGAGLAFLACAIVFVMALDQHDQAHRDKLRQRQAEHAEQLRAQQAAFLEAIELWDYGAREEAIAMFNKAGLYPEEPKRRRG
jgi:hypothetical protein